MPHKSKINTKKIINQELLNGKDVRKDKELETTLTSISHFFKTKKIFRELNKSKSKGFKAKDLFYSLIFSLFLDITSIFALSKEEYFLDTDIKQKKLNSKKRS